MLPPIVERELRVALRRRNIRSQWLLPAWIAAGFCVLFLLVFDFGPAHMPGRILFRWLFALACASVVYHGFTLTSDLFSEERRSGTLGLLVLTGMTPLEIFLNKLMGAVLIAAYGLLASLPFFALPFLAGGVSIAQFVAALVFIGNGLLFCVAMGVLASVLHRDGGQAQVTAVAITAMLCGVAPLLFRIYREMPKATIPKEEWLTLSPALAPALLFGGFTGTSPKLFWMSSGFTLVYSLSALLLAATILQRTWRDEPENAASAISRRRKLTHVSARVKFARARLLAERPFCWLATRNGRPVQYAVAFVGLACALWAGGCAVWGTRWLNPTVAVFSSVILHGGIGWIIAHTAGRQLAEDRLSGGFEIMLTTPVTSRDIVEGQFRALLFQFRTVLLVVYALDVVLCVSSLQLLNGTLWSAVVYVGVWGGLMFYWFASYLEMANLAMWISAWTGRPGYAAVRAVNNAATMMFWCSMIFAGVAGFVRGRGADGVLFFILLSSSISSFSRRRTVRQKLTNELKWIAAAPIPARGDKRFKSWNPQAIHPPGRWGEFALREATTLKPVRAR